MASQFDLQKILDIMVAVDADLADVLVGIGKRTHILDRAIHEAIIERLEVSLETAKSTQQLAGYGPSTNPSNVRKLEPVAAPISSKHGSAVAANETPQQANGRRTSDPIYDFLILECLQVFAQKELCVSKRDLCNMLRIYTPSSNDNSVGTKLNSWHEDKVASGGKGYVSWKRPSTKDISITGQGKMARQQLYKYAKTETDKISQVFEEAFGFQHQIAPS